VEDWLKGYFPGTEVMRGHHFDRELHLFRIRGAGSDPLELEVTDEALGDYSAAEIVADLERKDLKRRLVTSPKVRLMYDRHGRLVPTDRHSSSRQ
jgi:hypothetical protein